LTEYSTFSGRNRNVEGAVLAGGKSVRMGRDKALLSFGRSTILETIFEALRPLVHRIRVIGRGPVSGLALGAIEGQPDLRPGLGPLSGIHAALASASAEVVVVAGCDYPFVTTAFLEGLLRALTPEFDAVVPCPGGIPVAVCGVYRARCLGQLERRLDARQLSAGDFARSLRSRLLDETDLRALDASGRSLFNVNTPEDYAEALQMLESEGST
jgi:molybdopterin-guanine dinucleotide biosynthesis protein A